MQTFDDGAKSFEKTSGSIHRRRDPKNTTFLYCSQLFQDFVLLKSLDVRRSCNDHVRVGFDEGFNAAGGGSGVCKNIASVSFQQQLVSR